MLIRIKHVHPRYGISYGYKTLWFCPKKRPSIIKNPERLMIIKTPAGNWMRRFVLNFMAPSPLRRRILDSI